MCVGVTGQVGGFIHLSVCWIAGGQEKEANTMQMGG